MKTYIMPHMTEALAEHVLEPIREGHYLMRKPATGIYHVHIAEVGSHIVLTGDLTIGHHGCVSTGGYGLEWFGKVLSEDYLCSKFLKEVWQWEAAEDWLRDQIKNWEEYDIPKSHIHTFERLLSGTYAWNYDAPERFEFYETLLDLGQGYVDDGVPGYDYPRADAGWLCAVNQRFAALRV